MIKQCGVKQYGESNNEDVLGGTKVLGWKGVCVWGGGGGGSVKLCLLGLGQYFFFLKTKQQYILNSLHWLSEQSSPALKQLHVPDISSFLSCSKIHTV